MKNSTKTQKKHKENPPLLTIRLHYVAARWKRKGEEERCNVVRWARGCVASVCAVCCHRVKWNFTSFTLSYATESKVLYHNRDWRIVWLKSFFVAATDGSEFVLCMQSHFRFCRNKETVDSTMNFDTNLIGFHLIDIMRWFLRCVFLFLSFFLSSALSEWKAHLYACVASLISLGIQT